MSLLDYSATNDRDPWEEWDDEETWCEYCQIDVRHGLEGCPEEYRCLFPGRCCMPSYSHTSDECYTAEMADEYDRYLRWEAFKENWPTLHWLCQPFLIGWQKFPYFGGLCRYCLTETFWPDDIPCFACTYERAWDYLDSATQRETDDVPF